jgi:hypothetical protein
MAITWEEPPEDARRKGNGADWFEIAAELRSNPNRWALVREDAAPSAARQIKKGLVGGMVEGEFEARTVTSGQKNGRAKIYARYVGADLA